MMKELLTCFNSLFFIVFLLIKMYDAILFNYTDISIYNIFITNIKDATFHPNNTQLHLNNQKFKYFDFFNHKFTYINRM